MHCPRPLWYATLLAALAVAQPAHATFVVDIVQSGPNVVMSGSGTVDLTGLTFVFPSDFFPFVEPVGGLLLNGGVSNFVATDVYSGTSGPTQFGSGGITRPNSETGDLVGINNGTGDDFVYVPSGYVSGSSLSGSMTFNNTTISALGITGGTYTWTWGTGPDADSFIIVVPTAPEPGALTLLASGCLGLALLRHRIAVRTSTLRRIRR